MHENRETSETLAAQPGRRSVGEGQSHKVRMYVSEESHGGIVPMNPSNKDEAWLAEKGEGRQARDVRLSGLHAHQREERVRAVHGEAQDDSQTHAGETAGDEAAAPCAYARSRASDRLMAQVDCAGPLQRLCGTRKPRQSGHIPGADTGTLATCTSPPKPAPVLLDTCPRSGCTLAS
jgi:hypothetical protein